MLKRQKSKQFAQMICFGLIRSSDPRRVPPPAMGPCSLNKRLAVIGFLKVKTKAGKKVAESVCSYDGFASFANRLQTWARNINDSEIQLTYF